MSDSTSNPVSFPFDSTPNDKRPLPEIVADRCGFPLAYVDHTDGKRYYAVQDWIAGVAQAHEPRKFWQEMKKRLRKAGVEMSTWYGQLPYRAKDGKHYKMDHAQAEALYQITQRMDANTGIRDKVLAFLAKAGVVIDEVRIDPDKAMDAAIAAYKRQGKSDEWIATRLKSKAQRLVFTAAFQRSMRIPPQQRHYALITNEMRLGVWKRNTAMLKKEMGLGPKDTLRDHQSGIALTYEQLAEQASAWALEQKRNLEFDQAKQIVREKSEFVGQQAAAMGRYLGIDVATNRPLLTDGDTEAPVE